MKTVAIIQARMGSVRLPGKVLMPILDQPLLKLLIDRVRCVGKISEIVVATSLNRCDDQIEEFVKGIEGIVLFRGSEKDVLSRFVGAAKLVKAEIIMRITADNPFFDCKLSGQAIKMFTSGEFDYLSTPGYPLGVGIEVFTAEALFEADREAFDPYDREHVTPYFYRNPSLFNLAEMRCPEDLSHLRLTVDTPEDMERAKSLFARFGVDVTFREVVDAKD